MIFSILSYHSKFFFRSTKETEDGDDKQEKSFWNKMDGFFRKDDKKQKNDNNDNNMINLSDEQLLYPSIFGSYNYSCFPEKVEDNLLFYYLVTYGYTSLVEYFLKEKDININSLIISKNYFNSVFFFKLFYVVLIFKYV